MAWDPELEELKRRELLAERLGGRERVERQRAAGRLTIRERIARLLDPESFHEVGKIAGRATYDAQNDLVDLTPSNFVFGRGRIDGRPVVVGGDDFTVRGGSADATIKDKHNQCERMAHDLRLPLVRLVEGSGGGGSVKTIETTGRANVPAVAGWEQVVANMATVPRVALGLGSVAGLGAARLAAAHYSVMVKGLSALFVAGPPVVERTRGEALEGGAGRLGDPARVRRRRRRRGHGGRGLRSDAALPVLPALVDLRSAAAGPPDRRFPSVAIHRLIDVVPRDPRKVYRMRTIVEAIVDQGSFFEIASLYGCSIDHRPRPPRRLAGGVDGERSDVLRRRLDGRRLPEGRRASSISPDTFHLPVVHLVDCPGFLIGSQAEQTGTIKQGVRAMSAIFQTTVPWCSVIIRNVFGVAGAAHPQRRPLLHALRLAVGRWGSLPLEGGIEAAYRAELDAAPDPEQKLAEIEERLNKLRSPFRSPRRSGSKRSSTRATPGRCCASSPGWQLRCASRARRHTGCGRRPGPETLEARSRRAGWSVRLNGWSTRPRFSSVTTPSKDSSPASPRITGLCPSPCGNAM